MKNRIKKLFLLAFITVGFASCDLGDDKELDYGSGSYVAQFPFAEKTGFFLKDDAVEYEYEIPVELVGGNGLALTTDVNLTYEVDMTASTAVEGTNFDFVNTTKSTVIPAGSTFASIKIKVYSGTLDDQNPPLLVLKLTQAEAGGTDLVTSGTKGSIALTLQGTCTSSLSGIYNTFSVRTSPNGGPYTVALEPIIETAPGTYLTEITGNFKLASSTLVTTGPFNAQTAPAPYGGYIFKEVCGKVALENQQLFNYFSATVTQDVAQYNASFVDPESGIITIEYTIGNLGGAVPIRKYKSIYTPQ